MAGGLRLDLKDIPALPVEESLVHKLVDPLAWLERGIQMNQRIGPEQARIDFPFHKGANPIVLDLDETPDVVGILVDEAISKSKDTLRRTRSMFW